MSIVNRVFGYLSLPKNQILVLIVATLLVYGNTLFNGFVWDDNVFIEWQLTKDFQYLPELLKGAFPHPHEGDFRPFKGVILLFNYFLFEKDAALYHLQAIIIHIFVVILIYKLSSKIFEAFSIPNNDFFAFISALIFAIHPIHAEAITFMTASSDIIGIILFLSSLYLYITAFEKFNNKLIRITSSLLLGFAAFFTYEITLVLPVIIILYDLLIGQKGIKKLFKKIPVYFIYFAFLACYVAIRFILGVFEDNKPPGDPIIVGITMIKAFFIYLQITILPINMTVNHIIPDNIPALFYVDFNNAAFFSQKISDFSFIKALLVLSSLIIVSLAFIKKAPIVTFSVLWFFITLLPVSNIIALNNFMTERYLYLASFGFCLLIAYIFSRLIFGFENNKIIRGAAVLLMMLLIIFYSGLLIVRNAAWKDGETFWAQELKMNPNSVLANHNFGVTYIRNNDYKNALPYIEKAYSISESKNKDAVQKLGYLYHRLGKLDKAVEFYKIILEDSPNDFVTITNIANVYRSLNKVEMAKKEYERALAIEPNYYDARIGLGAIYGSEKKYQEAVHEFEQASEIRPDIARAWQNLAISYMQLSEWDKAKGAIDKVLRIEPNNKMAKELLDRLIRDDNIRRRL